MNKQFTNLRLAAAVLSFITALSAYSSPSDEYKKCESFGKTWMGQCKNGETYEVKLLGKVGRSDEKCRFKLDAKLGDDDLRIKNLAMDDKTVPFSQDGFSLELKSGWHGPRRDQLVFSLSRTDEVQGVIAEQVSSQNAQLTEDAEGLTVLEWVTRLELWRTFEGERELDSREEVRCLLYEKKQ